MKNKILYLTIASSILGIPPAKAQTTFGTSEYLDVNNIKSAVLVHGDMWWNPAASEPRCEFPKGSGKHLSHATSLWIAGYDAGNDLHVSAQTYRQSGNDFWPGPLDVNDTLTYASSEAWAKIWKVNLVDINTYLATPVHTLANTHPSILEWPAKGNIYAKGNAGVSLNITEEMAPFHDANNDGIYDPLAGDYPQIEGDQALWWVFSDNGATHNHSSNTSKPLKVQIHAMVYAYNRGGLKDNVQYYKYTVHNKSADDYTNFRMGLYADVDLGAFRDDFIGFDSSRRMGIVYNGSRIDGSGYPGEYGVNIPQMGITIIEAPGDEPPVLKPAGSFMYYNNDFSALGNPSTDTNYYRYLNATWLDGEHLKNDFSGAGQTSSGRGAGPDASYVYNGDPSVNIEWSECAAQNPYGDRRFIIATGDYDFNGGTSVNFKFALVATDPAPNNGCVGFAKIQEIADTAWSKHIPTNVTNMATGHSLKLYPNPANDILYLDINAKNAGQLKVYDMMGKQIQLPFSKDNTNVAIDIHALPAGIYTIRYQNENEVYVNTFVKE